LETQAKIRSAYQELIRARNAIGAHAQDVVVNGLLLL